MDQVLGMMLYHTHTRPNFDLRQKCPYEGVNI
jgi:hypothetical protein